MASERTAPPLVSLRGLTAGLLAAAGAVHLLVASQRSASWALEAAALATWGVLQVAASIWILVAATHRAWWAASALSITGAAAWLLTRTAGYPFGPLSVSTPSITGLEVAVAATELMAAALAGAVLLADGRLDGRAGLRFENLTALLVAAAAVPGVAASSWLEAYATGPTGAPTHTHTMPMGGSGSSMSREDRAALGDELVAAQATTLRIDTLADARAAGLVPTAMAAGGVGVQAFDPEVDPSAPLDLARPHAWIFADSDDDAPVVGLLYDVVGSEAPEGFTGDDDPWHLHPGECIVTTDGGAEIAMPLDPIVTGDDCSMVDGRLTNTAHWMLRVWTVPGWENPSGTFAHDNPLLPAG